MLWEVFMIDMHSHILFGVDDGAVTIQDSVELIRREIDNGVNSIILTPHFNTHYADVHAEKIMQNYYSLKKIAEHEKINIKLYLGNEIYFGSDFYEVLEKKNLLHLQSQNTY